MSRRTLALLFLSALLVFAVARLPLRGLLGDGLAAASVTGSVWNGRVVSAQWRGVMLGDLAVALAPLSVVMGDPQLAVSSAQLGGVVHLTGTPGIRALSGTANVAGIGPVRLEAVSIRYDGGACQEASGQMVATVAGETLVGALACVGRDAEAAMARADGVVVARGRLSPDTGFAVLAP